MSYNLFEGKLKASDKKFAIVVSRFNNFLTDKLLEGAVDCLSRHGAEKSDISVAYVPGAFEIPYAAEKLAKNNNYDAVICIGAVIRGDTPHFDYIANESAKGIAKSTSIKAAPVTKPQATKIPRFFLILSPLVLSFRSVNHAKRPPKNKGVEVDKGK